MHGDNAVVRNLIFIVIEYVYTTLMRYLTLYGDMQNIWIDVKLIFSLKSFFFFSPVSVLKQQVFICILFLSPFCLFII